jgi:hypothetical protein
MGKPGFGLFTGRRKSQSNALEDADPNVYLNPAPSTEQGGFRVLNRADIERQKQETAAKKSQEKTSKFGRFSTFGASGNKGRTQSIDEDSPSSSKRYVTDANGRQIVLTKLCTSDSKSSSGTQSFMSRPYHPGGSSSTLPSSAESDPNDGNLFANMPPRPVPAQANSTPNSLSMGGLRKQLPPVPYPTRAYTSEEAGSSAAGSGRARALTTSSYASTAIAPKLEADLDFGDSGFENMFSGLERKESPELRREPASPGQPGRSLLQGRRTFQSEPIKIDRQLDVEAPLTSWDSRGSEDNLMESPSEDDRSPPPVPLHKFSQYAPVASNSPELRGANGFEDEDAKMVSQSARHHRKSIHELSPQRYLPDNSTSAGPSRPAALAASPVLNNNTTPQKAKHAKTPSTELEESDLFGSPNSRKTAVRKSSFRMLKENIPPSRNTNGDAPRRVMTAAEFQAHQRLQATQPADNSSEEEDDYEDEEEAIRKREEELKMIRQRQQLQIAREHMRRSTAPGDPKAGNGVPPLSNGFPSETSMQADEWSDEDVPLGVLAQHGFPARGKAPIQPPNATPSYFRSSSPQVPERPASTGAMGTRASTYRPPFARNLPEDPYATMGNGIVRQPLRESMGFNRPASVFHEPIGGSIPLDAQPQFTSLVDQIQMRDNAKQKYMGGASAKKPTAGPFTGALGSQMNSMGQDRSTRMSQMPPMGMNGMPMMNMMGGQMPMMGMPQMQFPMYPQNELMMQQMYQQMLQMQAHQNAMFGGQQVDPRMSMFSQQQAQDPRMSMFPQANNGLQNPQFQNNSFLNVGGAANQQRPMSIVSVGVGHSQPNLTNRPYSTLGQPGMPQTVPMNNGYTPSIAPSERSNIGLSARYRPVVTGNGMADTQSTVGSSITLQATTAGAPDSTHNGATGVKKTVKGILKHKVPQVTVREDDEDDWGKMAARKSKYFNRGGKEKESDGLPELVRGVGGL